MTPRLPPSLRAWEEPLSAFPEELALSLGPWLQRLSLGVGPMRARTPEGRDAPDGYGGLTRRGPYERLLSSEWLLATELPEEFTRRAAMREHAFLEPSFRADGGGRRSVALFDTGPSQLGTPRIAHLATLLVLAKRAKDAGAAFAWGFLQQPEAPLLTEVTPVSVRRLLSARTAVELGEAHVDEWADALSPKQPDDVWLVGGPRLSRFSRALRASAVVVRDVLEPNVRRVSVSVRRPAAPETALALELPAPDACTKLLRDPFATVTAQTRVEAKGRTTRIQYSSNGRRLVACLADGSVSAYPIPNSPRATLGKPRRFVPRVGHRVVAAGYGTRLLTATWHERDGLWLHGVKTEGFCIGHLEDYRPPPPGAPPSSAHLVWYSHRFSVVFLDGEQTLFEVDAQPPYKDRQVARGVSDLVYPPFRYLVRMPASAELPERHAVITLGESHRGKSVHVVLRGPLLPIVLGSNAVAVRESGQLWMLHTSGDSEAVHLPPNATLMDVAGGGRWPENALLVLAADLRTLVLMRPAPRTEKSPPVWRAELLCKAPAPVVQAVANPIWREVAYLTERGDVEVYSLAQEAVVLRLGGGAPARVESGGAR